jgi:hypothetical protein
MFLCTRIARNPSDNAVTFPEDSNPPTEVTQLRLPSRCSSKNRRLNGLLREFLRAAICDVSAVKVERRGRRQRGRAIP